MPDSDDEKIDYKNLLLETRDALVVMLSFFNDLTDKSLSLPFISDFDKLIEFANNYDHLFVRKLYDKIKKIKK